MGEDGKMSATALRNVAERWLESVGRERDGLLDSLMALVEYVRSEEREACAKVCNDERDRLEAAIIEMDRPDGDDPAMLASASTAHTCARLIRARSTEIR